MTAREAEHEFESGTPIRLAAVRSLADRSDHQGWDAALFLAPYGRPAAAPATRSAQAAAVATATRLLAKAVRFHDALREKRSRPIMVGHEGEAIALANQLASLLREIAPPPIGEPTEEAGEAGTPRGRTLWTMLDYSPERLQAIDELARDLEGAVATTEAFLRDVFQPRDRHRPGGPFGMLCRLVADILASTGFAPDGSEAADAVRRVALFVAAMDLVPRTRGSHRGDRIHFPRLIKRVRQALFRTV